MDSFAEYEALLDIDSEEGSMKGIVEHFIHWKKGRVIDVLSLKSTYALSASFFPASCVLSLQVLTFPSD